jgi:hypothetical protein
MESSNAQELLQLGLRLRQAGASPAALLCLDRVFRIARNLQTADDVDVSAYMRHFHTYLDLLREIANAQGGHERQGIRRLFGLSFSEADGTYLANTGTYLHGFISEKKYLVLRATEEGMYISSRQVADYLSRAVLDRLRIRVEHQQLAHKSLKVFKPCCISNAVFSQCNSLECHRQHVDVKTISKTWYSGRVGIHLQQIMILQVCITLASCEYLMT